uniref:Uncharacterized protein n=1 Tax=viral metagenome TaxID=1070528 RepID=A0A6M3XNY8_9ZZZZ
MPPAGLRQKIRSGDGIVQVKERVVLGREFMYKTRDDLGFIVPPGVPSTILAEAKRVMKDRWSGEYIILSANLMGRTSVNVVIQARSLGKPETSPPGWVHKGPKG